MAEVTAIYTDVGGSGMLSVEPFEDVLSLFEDGEVAQIELVNGEFAWVNFMNVAYISKDLV